METLHFSPGFSQGPGRQHGCKGKAAAGGSAPGLREQRLLGRPTALHGDGHSRAGPRRAAPRRAESPVSLLRTAAAAPEAPGARWRGGCPGGFKGQGPRQLRQRLGRLLLPLLHTPGLRASFPGEEGGG